MSESFCILYCTIRLILVLLWCSASALSFALSICRSHAAQQQLCILVTAIGLSCLDPSASSCLAPTTGILCWPSHLVVWRHRCFPVAPLAEVAGLTAAPAGAGPGCTDAHSVYPAANMIRIWSPIARQKYPVTSPAKLLEHCRQIKCCDDTNGQA